MMREIRFRAWSKIVGRMFSPCSSNDQTISFYDHVVYIDLWCSDGIFDKIIVDYLMQFTGMKDANGKEIYEGDIVETIASFGTSGKHPKAVGPTIKTVAKVIMNKEGQWSYSESGLECQKRISLGNATDWYRGYCSLRECVVIGNIYENPELLGD